ncbi:dnaJ homolog subfamily C member 13-like [Teleopsis dalmanni]|uniref:dnaJ homolog subfamily C member 13-like n=1 Tax=Teleopsis dalmanni TaxID=139649 RepID=UPI0018CD4F92|nr:dnaJ homolog subfamily C member 13-like [Teleopsis dalmanni]
MVPPVPTKDNVDLECFLVTKHSWKGKYKRILSIGTAGISTYNPDKFDLTNRWTYSDIIAAAPNKSNIPNEFVLTIKKDKKLDSIKLSSEYRNDILSSILKYYKEFADKPKNVQRFNGYKYHWSGITLPTVLEVTPCSLDQLDPTTNELLTSYMYKDIEGIIGISDYEGGIVMAYGGFSRLHLFKADNHHEIVQNIAQRSSQFLSIETKILKSQITLDQFERQRFGKFSDDQFQTSMTEFTVQKISNRHPEPVKRILCLTETTLLERDPQTYSVCTLRPLSDVFALIRDKDNLQKFCIEYKNGIVYSMSTPKSSHGNASSFGGASTGGRSADPKEKLRRIPSVQPGALICQHLIKEGTYGRIYAGKLGDSCDVLIKTVVDGASLTQVACLLQDASMLIGVAHLNVLPPLLANTDLPGPPEIAYPYPSKGNLKIFLQKSREMNSPLSTRQLVEFGLHVSKGLAHLHSLGIIHKDIATRNCYLDIDAHVKICDNALSRDLFPDDYHCVGDNENRPLKWMALESLQKKYFYTTYSDIWSLGVFFWELATLAMPPFEEVDIFELMPYLADGFRLGQPINCPDEFFTVMSCCWLVEPKQRPSFPQLVAYLQDFHEDLGKYI